MLCSFFALIGLFSFVALIVFLWSKFADDNEDNNGGYASDTTSIITSMSIYAE
jgi:hypothetical protein